MSEFEYNLISALMAYGESYAEADEEIRGFREVEYEYCDRENDDES